MARRPNALLRAAKAVIEEAGWNTMAREFVSEPTKRERIIEIVSRDASQRFGQEISQRMVRTLKMAHALS